jgi:conjugative transfer signal peptidase TraF
MTRRAAIVSAMFAGIGLVSASASSRHPPAYIWNVSASVPIGLYRVDPINRIDVADLVVVAPPEPLASLLAERGYLPKGVPMLKRVQAVAGATVCRHGNAIVAYGMVYGLALDRDSSHRLLPTWQGCRVVPDGQLFLMNRDAADSFDSRYFGPLPIASIVGRAVPVWTAERSEPAPARSGNSSSGEP